MTRICTFYIYVILCRLLLVYLVFWLEMFCACDTGNDTCLYSFRNGAIFLLTLHICQYTLGLWLRFRLVLVKTMEVQKWVLWIDNWQLVGENTGQGPKAVVVEYSAFNVSIERCCNFVQCKFICIITLGR